ncbi:MAG: hypothetical protein IH787_07745 [Nitrospirae bacterium]|nr:hypothetical protein [Nitrospirota bacterium]
MRLSNLLKSHWVSLGALLLIAVVVGVLIGNHYGMGADEYLNARVGGRTLTAWVSPEGYRQYLRTGDALAHHGPSYFAVFAGFSQLFTSIFTSWHLADGRHLANYLTFLLGVVFFYSLCIRLLPHRTALVTSAVFATQPVLFGLGFINQKDSPFMVFFMASIVAGFWVTDRWDKSTDSTGVEPSSETPISIWKMIRRDWRAAQAAWRPAFIFLAGVFILVLLDVLVFDTIHQRLKTVMELAYEGQAWAPINGLFALGAEDAYKTPLEAYFAKLSWGYWFIGRMLILLLALVAVLVAAKRALPSTFARVFPSKRSLYLLAILAGSFLGFTISIRPIAGFAGLLVSGYWIYRLKERSYGLLLVYWVTAGVVTYETWPYLWETPLAAFVDSLAFTVNFENHAVLFQGEKYRSYSLPWHFLPTLFTLQFTEPVMPLALVGVVSAVRAARRKDVDLAVLTLVALWFLVPFAASYLPGTVQWNGFRHMLFLIPPLFVFFGFGLKLVFDFVRSRVAQWVIILLLIAPGLRGIADLHPYEYIYFNAYAGGIEGAVGEYDLEYWCTSYRDAMEYLNQVAEPDATIFIRRPIYNAISFARPDQRLTKREVDFEKASYVLVCQRYPQDWDPANGTKVYEVRHGPAVFAEVYRLD